VDPLPGLGFGEIWGTDASPPPTWDRDAARAKLVLEPSPGGTRFRYFVVPPEDPAIPHEEMRRLLDAGFEQLARTRGAARISVRALRRLRLDLSPRWNAAVLLPRAHARIAYRFAKCPHPRQETRRHYRRCIPSLPPDHGRRIARVLGGGTRAPWCPSSAPLARRASEINTLKVEAGGIEPPLSMLTDDTYDDARHRKSGPPREARVANVA